MNMELRTALRHLAQRPLFPLLGATAMGAGWATALLVFAALNTLLWREVPGVSAPEQQVEIGRRTDFGFDTVSYPDFRDLREHNSSFEHVYAWTLNGAYLGLSSQSVHTLVQGVSEDYFDALGVRSELGRLLTATDNADTDDGVVIASHAAWRKHFNADPAAIGRTVRLNGVALTLVGVTEPAFRGNVAVVQPDFFVPLRLAPRLHMAWSEFFDSRGTNWLLLGARLRPGVSHAAAAAELQAVSQRWQQDYPRGDRVIELDLAALRPLPQSAGRELIIGLGATLLLLSAAVLALACSNLTGVLLARGEARQGELAMRAALGASRGRLIAQLFGEAMLVTLLAAAIALGLAWAGQGLLHRLPLPLPYPLDLQLPLDARLLGFALLSTALLSLGCGLLPALRLSRRAQFQQLHALHAGQAGQRQRLQLGLLALQSGLTLALLLIAAVSLHSLQRSLAIDTGFATDSVYVAPMDLTPLGLSADKASATMQDLVKRMQQQPGVEAAGYASLVPLSMARLGFGSARPTGVSGMRLEPNINTVGAGFFDAFEIPVRGRAIQDGDRPQSERVAVINRSLAQQLFGDTDPLGHEFELGGGEDWQRIRIVGLVDDGRYANLRDANTPFAFLAASQWPRTEFNLVVRGPADSGTLRQALHAAVNEYAADVPPPPLYPFAQIVSLSILPQQVISLVTASLGVLALLLACTGLYSVLALQIQRRAREFGVRRALGASARQIVIALIGHSSRWVLAGSVVGLLIGGAGLTALSMSAGELRPDALAVLAAVTCFLLMLLGASWLPLQHALRLQPMEALRQD